MLDHGGRLEVVLDRPLPEHAEQDFVLLLLDRPEWFSAGRPKRRLNRPGEIELRFEWYATRVAILTGCHLICPYIALEPRYWHPVHMVNGDSLVVDYFLTYPGG